jgi:S-adenosylmethionine:diacylglycerol 3-amino-3-carboxypropyl transferase
MSAELTVWERGRLDARVGPRQVLFGRMYEDATIELDAFRGRRRIFCIASAGCTAMTLAPHHEVVAVDINPVQLAYAEQRLGGDPGVRGRAERVMDFARFFAPVAGWWPSRVREFVDLGDPAEQMAYWHAHLNTWRFRKGLDALLSLTALRAFYSSPLLDCLPKRLGRVMRARMERAFATHPNRDNPYARSLLLGELTPAVVPAEAKDVRLVHSDAATFLEGEAPGSFDGFTLSNILDGADARYRERLFAAVNRAASPGSLVVLRSFSDADADAPANRAGDDRAMLWGSVLVRPASELSAAPRLDGPAPSQPSPPADGLPQPAPQLRPTTRPPARIRR